MLSLKKCIALMGAAILYIGAWAQPSNYPTAPPLLNLDAGEYFIRTDPGVGKATPISITAGTQLAGLNTVLSLTGVPVGPNVIGIRFRNTNGIWGHTSLAAFFKFDLPTYGSAAAVGNLTAAEYFFNADPGIGKAIPLTLPTQTNVSDLAAVLNLSSLPVGFYTLGIRTRNAQGQWGHTALQSFLKQDLIAYPTASPTSNIVAAEYFIGTDPGIGKATALTVVPATNIANAGFVLTIPSAPAIYTLGIRTRDAAGSWSHTLLRLYDNLTPATYPAAPAAPTALQRLEYFIDTDPGFGKGKAIPFTSSANVQGLDVAIDLTGVPEGEHRLFIRSSNNPYSLTTIVPFVKGSALPVTWQYVRGEMRSTGSWLWWGTASEANTSHFVVEHSTDGRKFEDIGTVAAAGNSNNPRQYQYTHQQPAAGFNYYRIRQVDLDGRFSLSAVVTLLQRQGLNQAIVAPNPVQRQLLLLLPQNGTTTKAEARIINSVGQVLQRLQVPAGATQLSADVGLLPTGYYRLQIVGSKGSVLQVIPFIKE